MAAATDRQIVINWSPWSLESVLAPEKIDWRFTSHNERMRARLTSVHVDLMAGKFESVAGLSASELERSVFLDQEVVYVTINLWSEPWLAELLGSGSTMSDIVADAFEELFVPILPRCAAREADELDLLRRGGAAILGVHMRTGGDGTSWTDPALEAWDTAVDAIHRSVGMAGVDPASVAVFFTTDDARAKALVREATFRFPVIMPNGPIAHIDRQRVTRLEFEQVIGEFLLLRSCDQIIGGLGGFGQLAALTARKAFQRRCVPT